MNWRTPLNDLLSLSNLTNSCFPHAKGSQGNTKVARTAVLHVANIAANVSLLIRVGMSRRLGLRVHRAVRRHGYHLSLATCRDPLLAHLDTHGATCPTPEGKQHDEEKHKQAFTQNSLLVGLSPLKQSHTQSLLHPYRGIDWDGRHADHPSTPSKQVIQV